MLLTFQFYLYIIYRLIKYRDVAQFGRALRSGRRGRRFESCHLDQKKLLFEENKSFFSYIRLRRVILLRSDIRLMPSDIVLRTVKEANII